MDFTQQLNIPPQNQSQSRQKLLIMIAIIGGILGIILLLASSLLSGKTSRPQMISTLGSMNELIEASELISDYQTSGAISNITASTRSVFTGHYRALNGVAYEIYEDFEFKPSADLENVQSSLDAAEQANNLDQQVITILDNSLTKTLGSLSLLAEATSNEKILQQVEAATNSLETLQVQLSER